MFVRYAKNVSTLVSWSLRRDAFKPIQCFIDKEHTVPKYPEYKCDCIKYCKHAPRPSEETNYINFQVIDNTVYTATPNKLPFQDNKTVVMYL